MRSAVRSAHRILPLQKSSARLHLRMMSSSSEGVFHYPGVPPPAMDKTFLPVDHIYEQFKHIKKPRERFARITQQILVDVDQKVIPEVEKWITENKLTFFTSDPLQMARFLNNPVNITKFWLASQKPGTQEHYLRTLIENERKAADEFLKTPVSARMNEYVKAIVEKKDINLMTSKEVIGHMEKYVRENGTDEEIEKFGLWLPHLKEVERLLECELPLAKTLRTVRWCINVIMLPLLLLALFLSYGIEKDHISHFLHEPDTIPTKKMHFQRFRVPYPWQYGDKCNLFDYKCKRACKAAEEAAAKEHSH